MIREDPLDIIRREPDLEAAKAAYSIDAARAGDLDLDCTDDDNDDNNDTDDRVDRVREAHRTLDEYTK